MMSAIIKRPEPPTIDEVSAVERKLERATISWYPLYANVDRCGPVYPQGTPPVWDFWDGPGHFVQRCNGAPKLAPGWIKSCERACREVFTGTTTMEMLAQAMEPASDAEISERLARLVAAFPNAAKVDLDGYGLALAEDVMEAQPSRLQIARACRRLRRYYTFLPTISEVLDEIAGAYDVHRECNIIRWLPQTIQDARAAAVAALEDQRQKQQQMPMPSLPERVAECVRRMDHGESVVEYSHTVIESARRRIEGRTKR